MIRQSRNNRFMKKLRFAVAILVSLTVVRNVSCALPLDAQSKPPLVSILQAELSRNIDVLKQQPVPAYYAAYTLYDSRSTQILASFGAIDRSDQQPVIAPSVRSRGGAHRESTDAVGKQPLLFHGDCQVPTLLFVEAVPHSCRVAVNPATKLMVLLKFWAELWKGERGAKSR